MKKSLIVLTALIGTALAAPVWAHHNSPMGTDAIEDLAGDNFDLMGMHDLAFESLDPAGATSQAMEQDPADTASGVPEELDFPYLSIDPDQMGAADQVQDGSQMRGR